LEVNSKFQRVTLKKMGTAKTQLNQEDFARYEFKYLLTPNLRDALELEVGNFMRFDGHVHKEFGQRYFVRSVYFDDQEHSAFYDKIDGIKTRKKYRIRTYENEFTGSTPIFLEEKGRHNERTFKRRVPIELSDVELICTPEKIFDLLDKYSDVPLISDYVYSVVRKSLRPVVVIDYLRKPYISDFDMNFRLTFDSELRAFPATNLLSGPMPNGLSCIPGRTVLEVKFNRRIPPWFHRILQSNNMRRLSISKFCVGIKVCGIAVDLS